jgi:TRAP-type transport system periplasmic protein
LTPSRAHRHAWTKHHGAAWHLLPLGLGRCGHGDAAALAQRQDFIAMTTTEQQNLTTKGLTFNKPDTEPFRKMLTKAGFYPDMKKASGDKAWALLEKYVGPLTS